MTTPSQFTRFDIPSFTNDTNLQIDKKKFHKMLFLMKALEDGWSIKKENDTYTFKKKHENRKEIMEDDYLEKMIMVYGLPPSSTS